MEMTQDRASELEDRSVEIIQYEGERERDRGVEQNRPSGTCGTIIESLTFISLESKKKEEHQAEKNIWRNNVKISQVWQKTNLQIHKAQWIPNRINPKKFTPEHIIINLLGGEKKKVRNLKNSQRKMMCYKGKLFKWWLFLIRNHGGQRKWNSVFKVLKEKNYQLRFFFP